MNICVIGAGVVGLTTALELQNEFPNSKITIIADKFYKNTTSYVAAGIFRAGTTFMGHTFEITKKWIVDAYEYWDNIRKTSDAPLAGVCQLSGYIFSKISKEQTRNRFIEDVVPLYREATEEELRLCEGDWKFGSYFTTILIENDLFLPYAMEKFKRQNGEVIEMCLNSFNELKLLNKKFDVIINCSGLGAKKLCSDYSLVPIRGQIVKVHAPWIKLAFYGDFDTYIIPGFEGVTLGGTRNYESYNTEVCKYDSLAIKERCSNMLPSLKNAKVIRESVGLRPHRSTVRVEFDNNYFKDKNVKVIHNYGHGSYGVTTSPGTAKYSVKILKNILSSSSNNFTFN